MLEETGWRARRPLGEVVHGRGRWEESARPIARVPRARAATDPVPPFESSDRVPPFDHEAEARAKAHQATLTKPPGSLGRLEDLATWYAGVAGAFPPPRIERATLAVFAADHGVSVEGVSAYGSHLTAATVANVMSGGAAVNAMAGEARIEIDLVDVGLAGDLSAVPTAPVVPLRHAKVRSGTENLRSLRAMLREEAEAAIAVGRAVAKEAIHRGADAIGLGEIGIGNTTSAAALACIFTGSEPGLVVGRGTGIDDDVLARKIAVVDDALRRHHPRADDPVGALAAVGGLEIAALVGCALEAARHRVPVVLDGFVTNAAALVAVRIDPEVRRYLLASHVSPEPGAARALESLGLVALFDLGMRLGEGTGAALALAWLRTAVHTQLAMATFSTAGIVGRAGFGETPP
jgi:nicotinate-nucleotide--dimethylbenzimidazole phosphoribosyltransferase